VLLYTLVLSVVTGLVFGALPALRASAGTLHGTLKDEGRGGTGGARRQRLRNALVTGELALSVVLLVGATLMIKTFVAMSRADAGFDESRILTLRTYTAGERYAGVPARAAYLEQLVARLEALPGVQRAVATSSIPTDDGGPPTTVIAEGRQVAPGDETAAQYFGSTPGLFEALGQPMLHGRGFTAEEARDSAARVVVLNKALAERLWPGQSAVGRRVRVPEVDSAAWLTVVGVARGLHYEEVGEESAQSRLQVHLPYARLGWRSMAVLVRTAGDPAPVAPAVRRQLRALDPTLPAYDVRTMAEVRHFTTWPNRLYSGVFGSFAAVAVLLAAIGVYGVMAYAVSQRAREIGIRMALGARGGDVLRMIVRQGARLAAAGVALGVGLALVVSRALSGVLYGVSAYDPLAFLAIPLLLAAVAVLASWLPARRATRVDPVVVLRAE
jgi:predicted permease